MSRWLRIGSIVMLLLFASLNSASPAWTQFLDGNCPGCLLQGVVFQINGATLYVTPRTNTFALVGVFTLSQGDPNGAPSSPLRSFINGPFDVTITVGTGVSLTYTFQQVAPQTYISSGPQGGQGWAFISPLGPNPYLSSFSATAIAGLPSPPPPGQNLYVDISLTFLGSTPGNKTVTKNVQAIFLPW